MKEICERTGLTDRAVRLYIEEGLLAPREEVSYTGRRSLIFSEEDAAVLSAIAVLRRAEFSLSDIGLMQKSPERIGEILTAHRERLAEDIAVRQKILAALEEIGDPDGMDCRGLADAMARPASEKIIPKEDSTMRFQDVTQIVRRRIPSLVALLCLLIGGGGLFPCIIRTLFASIDVQMGGGYQIRYAFSAAALGEGWSLLLTMLCLIGGAVLCFCHIVTGRRGCLMAGGGLVLLAGVLLLVLPEPLNADLFFHEFLGYRFSVFWEIFGYTEAWFDVVIRALKFVPIIASLVCMGVGLAQRKETE